MKNDTGEPTGIDAELPDEKDADTATSDIVDTRSLEDRLEKEIDKRLEDRFVFLIIILMLIDIILFNGATNTWLAVIILFLQILLVIAVAKKMRMETIIGIINRIIDSIAPKK